MRPRVFAAEDAVLDAWREAIGLASMRPRVFAAEDLKGSVASPRECCRFNEAAGIRRGRRHRHCEYPVGNSDASMRPRVFAAEDEMSMFVGERISAELQ